MGVCLTLGFCVPSAGTAFVLWVLPSLSLAVAFVGLMVIPFHLSACAKWFMCLAFSSFSGLALFPVHLCFVHYVGSWGRKLSLAGLDAYFPKSFRPDIACACRFGW